MQTTDLAILTYSFQLANVQNIFETLLILTVGPTQYLTLKFR